MSSPFLSSFILSNLKSLGTPILDTVDHMNIQKPVTFLMEIRTQWRNATQRRPPLNFDVLSTVHFSSIREVKLQTQGIFETDISLP